MTRKQAKKVLEEIVERACGVLPYSDYLTAQFYGRTGSLFGNLWPSDDSHTWYEINTLGDDYLGPKPTLMKAEKLRAFIEALPE